MRLPFLLLLLLTCPFLAKAQTSTMIMVRAKAKDAKFIGSSIGGAHIIIREAATGRILAEGLTEGSTGNTTQIMSRPTNRYDELADSGTAGFRAELQLEQPVFVTIEARGPAHHRQSQVQASTQMWLLPGKDILGDGVVLEIPGFIIDVLQPRTHQTLEIDQLENRLLRIKANMVMMCGCPITDGGLWNAREMEVSAIIRRNGEVVRTLPMAITQTPNEFVGEMVVDQPGDYLITVYGFDARTANTGLATVPVKIR